MPGVARGDQIENVFSKTGTYSSSKPTRYNNPFPTNTDSCSSDVFVNGIGVVIVGDNVKSHKTSTGSPDTSTCDAANGYNVFANSKLVAVAGSQYTGDNIIVTGSSNVIIGGAKKPTRSKLRGDVVVEVTPDKSIEELAAEEDLEDNSYRYDIAVLELEKSVYVQELIVKNAQLIVLSGELQDLEDLLYQAEHDSNYVGERDTIIEGKIVLKQAEVDVVDEEIVVIEGEITRIEAEIVVIQNKI